MKPEKKKFLKNNTDQFKSLAVVSEVINNNKTGSLLAALHTAFFFKRVEAKRKNRRLLPADFKIVIKPDLTFFSSDIHSFCDPEIVEHLIQILHTNRYTHVVIIANPGREGRWLKNRDLSGLAKMAGYGYKTDNGTPYNIIHATSHLTHSPFPPGCALHEEKMNEAWINADFRIVIGKNKTDREHSFSLCLKNLLSVLPGDDKKYYPPHKADLAIELLQYTPIDFCLIDAVVSNHGKSGTMKGNPINTNTIIASDNLLLADWVGSLKMGVDPYSSPLNAKALRTICLPKKYTIVGEISCYKGWINVPPVLSHSSARRTHISTLDKQIKPWIQSVDSKLFPFKKPVAGAINSFVISFLDSIDDNPLTLSAYCGTNYLISFVHHLIQSYESIYSKKPFIPQKISAGCDLKKYKPDDYDQIIKDISPLLEISAVFPLDKNGLRIQYIKKSVLSMQRRTLPLPFDDFISRIDLSRLDVMMNLSVGRAHLPVSFDSRGRLTKQVVRAVFFPNPLWMLLSFGEAVDTTKLMRITYKKNCITLFWKMVYSENRSAQCDDGLIQLKRDKNGLTGITLMTYQKFSHPAHWDILDPNLIIYKKDAFLSERYKDYFSRLINNLQSAYNEPTTAYNAGEDVHVRADNKITTGRAPSAEGKQVSGFIIPYLSKSPLSGKLLFSILKGMSLVCSLSDDLKKRLVPVLGCYQFRVKETNSLVTVIFRDKKMEVYEKRTGVPHITVTFKNVDALLQFILSPKPDILKALLKQEVTVDGNINYLMQFAYIANSIKLWATGIP